MRILTNLNNTPPKATTAGLSASSSVSSILIASTSKY